MINLSTLSRDELNQLWPSAAAELMNYANVLSRHNMELTAEQVRLAVQMANKYYESLKNQGGPGL